MQLLGSIIYVTSTFYCFEGSLLSTLDSLLFCIFMIPLNGLIFKMEYSIKSSGNSCADRRTESF